LLIWFFIEVIYIFIIIFVEI